MDNVKEWGGRGPGSRADPDKVTSEVIPINHERDPCSIKKYGKTGSLFASSNAIEPAIIRVIQLDDNFKIPLGSGAIMMMLSTPV